MMVDLAGEAGRVSLGYLLDGYASVGETMKAETHLAKGAFADGTLQGIIADDLELGRSELLAKFLVGRGESGLLVDGGTTALTPMMIGSASTGLTHGAIEVGTLQRARVSVDERIRSSACASMGAEQ